MTASVQSQRQLKVGELVKLALIQVLRKGKAKDPRLFEANVTITEVKISPDLQIANCYVMPFNSKLSKEDLLDAFEQSRYNLRTLVTGIIQLKYSPELRFFYDHELDNTNKIHDLITKVT